MGRSLCRIDFHLIAWAGCFASILLSGCSDPEHPGDFQSGVAALLPVGAAEDTLAGQVHIFTSSSRRQTLQWNLSGIDPRCGESLGDVPTGRCGIHIEAAQSCGGHAGGSLAARGTAGNPWLPVHYFAQEGSRSSTGYYSEVESGLSVQDLHSHALVVTDADGNLLACGLVCTLPSVALPKGGIGESALACESVGTAHSTTTESPDTSSSKVSAYTSAPRLKHTTSKEHVTTSEEHRSKGTEHTTQAHSTTIQHHSSIGHSHSETHASTTLEHKKSKPAEVSTSTQASHEAIESHSSTFSTSEPVVVKTTSEEHHSRGKEHSASSATQHHSSTQRSETRASTTVEHRTSATEKLSTSTEGSHSRSKEGSTTDALQATSTKHSRSATQTGTILEHRRSTTVAVKLSTSRASLVASTSAKPRSSGKPHSTSEVESTTSTEYHSKSTLHSHTETHVTTTEVHRKSKPEASSSTEASHKSRESLSSTFSTSEPVVVKTTSEERRGRGKEGSTTEAPHATSTRQHSAEHSSQGDSHVSTTVEHRQSTSPETSTSRGVSHKSREAQWHSSTSRTAESVMAKTTSAEHHSRSKEGSTTEAPHVTSNRQHSSKQSSHSETHASTTAEHRQSTHVEASTSTGASRKSRKSHSSTSSTVEPVVVKTTSKEHHSRGKESSTIEAQGTMSTSPAHRKVEHRSTSTVAPPNGERDSEETEQSLTRAVEVLVAVVGIGFIACLWCCTSLSARWRCATCHVLSAEELRMEEWPPLAGALSAGTFLMLLPAVTCGSEWKLMLETADEEILQTGSQFVQALGMVWAIMWLLIRVRAFLLRYDRKPPRASCGSPLWRLVPEALWIFVFSSMSSVLLAAEYSSTHVAVRLLNLFGLLSLYDWQVYATVVKCRPYLLHGDGSTGGTAFRKGRRLLQPLVSDEEVGGSVRTRYVVAPFVGCLELLWKPLVALVFGWHGWQDGSEVGMGVSAGSCLLGCCMALCAVLAWRISSHKVGGVAFVAGVAASLSALFGCGDLSQRLVSHLMHVWLRFLGSLPAGFALLVAAVSISAFMAWMDHHQSIAAPRSEAPDADPAVEGEEEEGDEEQAGGQEEQHDTARTVGTYRAPVLPEEDNAVAGMMALRSSETQKEAPMGARAVAHVPRDKLLVVGRSQSSSVQESAQSQPSETTEVTATEQLSIAAKREAIAAVKVELEACKDALRKAQQAHGRELLAKDHYVRELEGGMARSQAELAEITEVMTTRLSAMKDVKELCQDQVAVRDLRIRELESDLAKLHKLAPLPASQSSQERPGRPLDPAANV